jgi:hypothetical protein
MTSEILESAMKPTVEEVPVSVEAMTSSAARGEMETCERVMGIESLTAKAGPLKQGMISNTRENRENKRVKRKSRKRGLDEKLILYLQVPQTAQPA